MFIRGRALASEVFNPDGFVYRFPVRTPMPVPRFFASDGERRQWEYENIIMGLKDVPTEPTLKIVGLVDYEAKRCSTDDPRLDIFEVWLLPNQYTQAKTSMCRGKVYFTSTLPTPHQLLEDILHGVVR